MTTPEHAEKVLLRSEIAPEHTWNAPSVFPDQAAWQAEMEALRGEVSAFATYQGRMQAGPAQTLEVLKARDALMKRVTVATMYARMSVEVDKTNTQSVAMAGQAESLEGQARGAIAFIEPELLSIGQATLQNWLEQEPGLQVYAHYLDNLFRSQAHVRSAEVEEILGMLADPFGSVGATASLLTDADFKFEPAVTAEGVTLPVTQGTITQLYSHPEREVRRQAWEHYHDEFLAHKYSLTSNLYTSIKGNVFQARVRRQPSTLEAALFELNVQPVVFHNLIDTFRKHLPTWHRYFAIRRKALKLDTLAPYDMWAPLTSNPPTISYEQAVDMITQGLAPMGADYVETVRRGCLEDRWVDVYPNVGKTAGAFSYGAPGSHPFIVMSYTPSIFAMSTLAHELGHSMHSYLTWKTQPFIYSDYSLFVAEVASNFHQAMVRAHLLQANPDPAFQISVIEEAMANFYRYFLIMPTLARFELETHQRVERDEALTAEGMMDLMADLFSEAYGGEVEVDRERVGMVWSTFGHLYADYYVYQYATGISAANALSRRIVAGESVAVENYRRFLSAGGSVYPLEALRIAGVDMTTPQPVEEAFAVMEGLVDRLEKLV